MDTDHYILASTVRRGEALALCGTRIPDLDNLPVPGSPRCTLCEAGIVQVAAAQVYADKALITHEAAGKALNMPSLVVLALREGTP
jgi:hypothetical protein